MTKLMIIGVLLLIAAADWKTKKIPLYLLLLYTGLVLVSTLLAAISLQPPLSFHRRLLGAVAVSIPMLLLQLAIPGSWGRADIWLAAITGLHLGFEMVLLAAYLAIFLAGSYSIGLIMLKRKPVDSRIAFAPFWTAGAIAAMQWGDIILGRYQMFLV